MASLKDYLKKRTQSKLYKQWVAQSHLPAEEMPPELSNAPSRLSNSSKDTGPVDPEVSRSMVREMINLPVKYLILMLLLIAILLVALSVVTTLMIAWP